MGDLKYINSYVLWYKFICVALIDPKIMIDLVSWRQTEFKEKKKMRAFGVYYGFYEGK